MPKSPAMIGPHRIQINPYGDYEDVQVHRRQLLYRALNTRALVAFAGAGCSACLGYLPWREFAMKVVDGAKRIASVTEQQTLNRFAVTLLGTRYSSAQLVYALTTSQKIFSKHKKLEEYYAFVASFFAQPSMPKLGKENPYDFLLDVPIFRFITSNYDIELENAVRERRLRSHADDTDSCESAGKMSFTQSDKDRLAIFSLAAVKDAENLVFHCHGSYQDPHSMIVTEKDYRVQYLGADDSAAEFQQTLTLLFSSNPLLFVGYGLGDDDLLRPLRMFIATEGARTRPRPVFALMPLWSSEDAGSQKDFYDSLYERYAINIITFSCAGSIHDSAAFYEGLTTELRQLRAAWLNWWQDWTKKPAIRAPNNSQIFTHHTVGTPSGVTKEDWVCRNLKKANVAIEELWARLSHANHTQDTDKNHGGTVIVFTGPGGAGKTWLATKLHRHASSAEGRQFQGSFFWSSYYADDSLTGIDRALAFLESQPAGKVATADPSYSSLSRHHRLRRQLKTGHYLLVFDGIERFLRESRNPGDGDPYSPDIEEFFWALTDKESLSVAVLTSRLWPTPLACNSESDRRNIIRIPVDSLSSDDLFSDAFGTCPPAQLSELCSLLGGHVYALVLANAVLMKTMKEGGNAAAEAVQRRLGELIAALSRTPPDRRASRMIRESLYSIGDKQRPQALKLLEAVSTFASPIKGVALECCFRVMCPEISTAESGLVLKEIASSLTELCLLQKVEEITEVVRAQPEYRGCPPDQRHGPSFIMHPMIREYFFQRFHHAGDAVPNLTLPGFTAAAADVHLLPKRNAEEVLAIFHGLLTEAQIQVKQFQPFAEGERAAQDATDLCRSIFSLVRSRMGSLTVPRWTHYDRYAMCLAHLTDLARALFPEERWRNAEWTHPEIYQRSCGPLYADELAWLYNELGLVAYSEGNLLDALSTWDQGYSINKIIDGPVEGYYTIQSLCNLGAANIEYGYLSLAEQYLRDGLKGSKRLADRDHEGRFLGYLGLVQHLRGNLPEARGYYRRCLKRVKASNNSRAEAIFRLHLAHLKFKENNLDGAEADIGKARALAEAGRYFDVAAFARTSLGHLLRLKTKYVASSLEYQAAIGEARRIGIRKLEADVLSELSRLALDLGDSEVARSRAMAALEIANELGLGIRKTHGLVVLGMATIKGGHRDLGIAYLHHARRLANQQEYWLRMHEAEEQLYKEGELKKLSRVFN